LKAQFLQRGKARKPTAATMFLRLTVRVVRLVHGQWRSGSRPAGAAAAAAGSPAAGGLATEPAGAVAASGGARSGQSGQRGKRGRPRWRGLLSRQAITIFMLPSLLLIGLFSYYPAVRSLVGGFYIWNGFSAPRYDGFGQFSQYFHSSTFGAEARNLVLLVIGSIAITLVSQFVAAEVVAHLPGRTGTIAKYLLTLPVVLPPILLIDVWAYLLNPSNGLINRILGELHLPQPGWLTDSHLALVSILLIGFPWISNLGFLIFLGGVQHLPKEIIEASRVDGVSRLRRVFAIDIPLLMPQFRIVTILAGVYSVQNFIPILLLTNGGPGNATFVPGLDMYQSAFQNSEYGYGMAIGTVLFIAMLIFTIIVMRTLRPRT
jgi:raffinose/stachyose/melibiose transport system permease protein